jgi:hypothetical protein
MVSERIATVARKPPTGYLWIKPSPAMDQLAEFPVGQQVRITSEHGGASLSPLKTMEGRGNGPHFRQLPDRTIAPHEPCFHIAFTKPLRSVAIGGRRTFF